jgi:hypothetical protein
MLNRDSTRPVVTHDFVVSVELETGGRTSPEQVAARLADSLQWLDDVGTTDITYLGAVTPKEANGRENDDPTLRTHQQR